MRFSSTVLASLSLSVASRSFRVGSPFPFRHWSRVSRTGRTCTTCTPLAMVITDAPFGAWESPITSKAITAGSVGIGSLKIDDPSSNHRRRRHHHHRRLFWLEGRPQEAGRYVLCRYDPDAHDRSDRNAVDVTPKGSNVRTRVHEYGGGAVTLGSGEDVFYSEFRTQRLMKLAVVVGGGDGEPEPITPDGERFRFADGVYDGDNRRVIMVREDHEKSAAADVVNELVAVDVDGSETVRVLATGNDFYAAPRLSPDGTKMAYVTWNHPNMPWDATELRVSSMESGDTSEHDLIAGHDGDTSIIQPLWHPLSGELYYISDESGYYNIYRAGTADSILPMDKDFGGPAPGWTLGQQGFNFFPDGRLVATYTKDGSTRLVVANVSGDGPATEIKEYGIDDGLPMQFGGVIGTESNDLYFIGGSPSTPTSVYQWSLETRGAARQLACSSSLSFPDDVISVPEQIEFPTTLGTAFGYYYPPRNGKFQCTTESAPPLLVKAHGGPTACTGTSFNAGIQFWTSRGFAVLDVDYGGSTGYGRDYRRRLRGTWGIVDLDDVCAGAQHLVKQGLADPKRLCIDGGSAGGYTTLSALAFRDVFTAGCSLYGIGDLTALAGDTHKFESRYLDGLVGFYPKDKAIYEERSPINSVETLNCPILLLQGDEDKVVPPNQAEMMHTALLNKGIATCIKMYKGEQHGFRKSENIEDALDSELAFYGRVYGINVPGAVEINIDNM